MASRLCHALRMVSKEEHSKRAEAQMKSNAAESLKRLRAGTKKKLSGAELAKSARQTQTDAQHIRDKAAEARKKSSKREDVNQAAFRIMQESTEKM